MSITSRINEMSTHIEQAYDELQGLGADLTNVDKNIENISMVLDDIYDSLPSVSDEGTSLTLNDTRVGKIKSTLKGNTSQDGTPNPSYPQPVNVVSGDNEINVCGKNLFNANEVQIGKAWNNTSNNGRAVIIIPVEQNVPYTISMNGNNTMDDIYVSYSAKTLSENAINGVGLSQITTFPRVYTSSTNYIILQFNKSSVSLSDIKNLKLQVEKGSTATTYEPYIGASYPINLGVKNLFDKSTANLNKGVATANGGLYNSDINFSTDYIEVKTNGTYYTASGVSSVANRVYGAQYDSNKQYVGAISTNVGQKTFYISDANVKYIRLTGLLEEIDTYQIEEGSKANTYTPYGTTPIELCKIGNYQDSIKKSTGRNLVDILNGTIVKRENATYTNINRTTNTLSYNITGTVAGYLGFVVPIEVGKQYTLSFDRINGYIYTIELDNMITEVGTNYGTPRTSGYSFTATKPYIGIWAVIWAVANADGGSYASISNLILNEGSTPLPYEPYGKGKWYLHKEIGKVVLSGSESWAKGSSRPFYTLLINDILRLQSTGNNATLFCNYLSPSTPETIWGNNINGITNLDDSNAIRIRIQDDPYTITTFKEWLNDVKPVVYYALATPTNELVEYQPLIDQLNLLEKAQSKENQTSISQVNNDLPFIISASVLKEWSV